MNGLLSVSEARQKLLEAFSPVKATHIDISEAAGRVLAEDIRAEIDLPAFDNSSMDGFAVRLSDLEGASRENPVCLDVSADLPAGKASYIKLHPGQAVRIMTGAPLPDGAEAVIPVEDSDFNTRQPGATAPKQVNLYRKPKNGENIRPRGQDVHRGEIVLHANHQLRSQDIGFLAMLGIARPPIYQKPRVALLSTGDELLPLKERLQPGKIYESNSYMLSALVSHYGGEPVNLGIVADRADAVRDSLRKAAEAHVDLILSSAGVSVGAFDYVRSVVEEEGRLSFWRVNMRPGKPLAFGSYHDIPFIGLPGNPVSAFVGFEVFACPALIKLGGMEDWSHPVQRVVLQEAVESDGRESYLRARVTYEEGLWKAYLTGHQGSGNLRSLVQANALLIIASGVKSLPAGSEVDAWLMD